MVHRPRRTCPISKGKRWRCPWMRVLWAHWAAKFVQLTFKGFWLDQKKTCWMCRPRSMLVLWTSRASKEVRLPCLVITQTPQTIWASTPRVELSLTQPQSCRKNSFSQNRGVSKRYLHCCLSTNHWISNKALNCQERASSSTTFKLNFQALNPKTLMTATVRTLGQRVAIPRN